MKALILDELIWTELAEVLPQVELAIIPVGSCEQHGPNTTYNTDTARAYSFSKLIGEHFGNQILICPPVTYGISSHHMMFPGTVTLTCETYINVLKDIAIAINKHGIKRIVYINGHGGNKGSLDVAITSLKYEHGIDAYYSAIGETVFADGVTPEMGWTSKRGHASESETSQAMALCPEVVRENRQKGEVVEDFIIRGPDVPFKYGGCAWDWKHDASTNGALGDARLANLDDGIRINNIALGKVEKMIRYIIEKR
jgi:creatinine amidohydrolase